MPKTKKLSQQNNMTIDFIDEFDIEKIRMLYCMTNEELLLNTNYKEYSTEENNKYVNKIKLSLKELILSDTNKINRQYEKKNCNRIYCKKYGLQYFSNNILHYILPKNTVEYDMKNAQPTIMLYLFKKHNLDHKHLENYVKNRDTLLKQDNMKKTDITALMNKDKPKLNNCKEWVKDLIEEYSMNKPILMGLENDKIKEEYRKEKKKTSNNFISSMVCAIYYYYECEILLKAIEGHKCIVPKYDGFLSDENIDIEDLNKVGEDYGVVFCKKIVETPIQHKDYTMEQLNNLLYPSLLYPVHFLTTLDLAERIYRELKKTITYSLDNWYCYNGKLWGIYKSPFYFICRFCNDELNKTLKTKLEEIKNDSDYELQKEEIEKQYLSCKKLLDSGSFKSGLIDNLKTLLYEEKFVLKLDNLPEKFVFEDGIYDVRKNTFRKGIEKDDYVSKTLPYPYNPNINEENKKWILDQLLKITNMNKEHLEYYLNVISFCLLGVPQYQQEIYCLIGQGASNGKSIALEALLDIFSIYITKGETKLFESDCNKKHKFLKDYIGGLRLVIHNEMDDKKEVDSKMFKEIADGETIKNEILFGYSDTYKITAKPVILGNYTLKFDKMDKGVERRYKHLQFNSKFHEDYEIEKENPKKLQFLKDKKFKNKLIERKDEFINIIIEYGYKYLQKEALPEIPLDFKQAQEEALEANNDFENWFICNQAIYRGDDKICSSAKLLKMYNEYATSSGTDKIPKNRDLVNKMKALGFTYNKDKMCEGVKGVFIGFEINDEYLEKNEKTSLQNLYNNDDHKDFKPFKTNKCMLESDSDSEDDNSSIIVNPFK